MIHVDKNQLRGIVERNINEVLNSALVTPSLNWDTYGDLVEHVTTDLHNIAGQSYEAGHADGYVIGTNDGYNKGLEASVERDELAAMRRHWDRHADELRQIVQNHNGIMEQFNIGNKITAIKMLRELTYCGLKQAKEAVEAVGFINKDAEKEAGN